MPIIFQNNWAPQMMPDTNMAVVNNFNNFQLSQMQQQPQYPPQPQQGYPPQQVHPQQQQQYTMGETTEMQMY